MPHWLIALLAVLAVNVLVVIGGFRWRSAKPQAATKPIDKTPGGTR